MTEQSHAPSLQAEEIDIKEKGAPLNGQPQVSTKRLFIQLQVFTGLKDLKPIQDLLERNRIPSAIYKDVNDPKGFGIVMMAEDPNHFAGAYRDVLNHPVFDGIKHRRDMTMFGRTYSTGREQNLEDWLLAKPKKNILNPEHHWAIWYPLRRHGEFETLTPAEQGKIMAEHAIIGMSYGRTDLGHDVRLACHGLDKNDQEFVIGIVGKDLFPLSHLIQRMRRTVQTSKYIASLGPFFVGRTFWQSPL
ncbi:MAG TPA: hypothetical protein DIS66_04795 [Candidatus Omnitrophica bacterium]|nr:hypothetical protein [Candidatus Omnitrophota bacterium]